MQSNNSNHKIWVHYCIGPGVQLHNPNPFRYWLWFVLFGGGFILLEIIPDPRSCRDSQNKGISWFTSDPFVNLI